MLRRLSIILSPINVEQSLYSRGVLSSAVQQLKPKNNNQRSKKESKIKSSNSFGLDRKERKDLRKRLIENHEETKDTHPFKQLYPWESKQEFAQHLKDSQIYNKDGLIALCKPYGISKSGSIKKDGQTDSIVQTINMAGQSEYYYSIQDTIPLLSEMYKVKDLEIIKTCERWSSGVVLLSSKTKTKEKFHKIVSRIKPAQITAYSYLALTIGRPMPETFSKKVGICLDYVAKIGKVPIIKEKINKNAIERGEIRSNVVDHSILHYNDETEAALLKINTQIQKWHFLRVWMAHCYSPILGDNIYNGRVKTLAGRRILISPQNNTSYNPMELPLAMANKLGIPENALEIIPCHLHLHEVTLPGYLSNKRDLVIRAPTPNYFNWTCEQMGLSNPYLS